MFQNLIHIELIDFKENQEVPKPEVLKSEPVKAPIRIPTKGACEKLNFRLYVKE